MKKVEALIDSSRLDRVRAVVDRVGADDMTVTEVRGYQPDATHVESYRGSRHTVFLVSRMKVEIVVEDGRAPALVEELNRELRTWGRAGDKLVVYSVEQLRPPGSPVSTRPPRAAARRPAEAGPAHGARLAETLREALDGVGPMLSRRSVALVLVLPLALLVHAFATQRPPAARTRISGLTPQMTHLLERNCKKGRWSHGAFFCLDPAPAPGSDPG